MGDVRAKRASGLGDPGDLGQNPTNSFVMSVAPLKAPPGRTGEWPVNSALPGDLLFVHNTAGLFGSEVTVSASLPALNDYLWRKTKIADGVTDPVHEFAKRNDEFSGACGDPADVIPCSDIWSHMYTHPDQVLEHWDFVGGFNNEYHGGHRPDSNEIEMDQYDIMGGNAEAIASETRLYNIISWGRFDAFNVWRGFYNGYSRAYLLPCAVRDHHERGIQLVPYSESTADERSRERFVYNSGDAHSSRTPFTYEWYDEDGILCEYTAKPIHVANNLELSKNPNPNFSASSRSLFSFPQRLRPERIVMAVCHD